MRLEIQISEKWHYDVIVVVVGSGPAGIAVNRKVELRDVDVAEIQSRL